MNEPNEPQIHTQEESKSKLLAAVETAFGRKMRTPIRLRWLLVAIPLLIMNGLLTYHFLTATPPSAQGLHTMIIRKGPVFTGYDEYLKLFGIHAKDTLWYQRLPHHPNVSIWGPQYHHPHWHNDGNKDSLMPTITEYRTPADYNDNPAAREIVKRMNHESYFITRRLNEVRLTFMRNLTDTGFVFLGVYRMSLALSDTTHIVWERVADECDLNNLNYLEQLRN
ncbi:MAG: hypothetical protein IJV06_08055 [Bacteroidaceae bacterium]|nr:hypothetical protein [Bacteroidaceae bacterium]